MEIPLPRDPLPRYHELRPNTGIDSKRWGAQAIKAWYMLNSDGYIMDLLYEFRDGFFVTARGAVTYGASRIVPATPEDYMAWLLTRNVDVS